MSLQLQPETESAENLEFSTPMPGFEERSSDKLDGYFVHLATGNSISIKSACFDPADPSLDTLKHSAFNGMTIKDDVEDTKTRFSKRAAITTKKRVEIDGVDILVEILIFKKNNCNYLISHIGVESSFGKTEAAYKNFLSSVRAP